jgi:hypothetical protein
MAIPWHVTAALSIDVPLAEVALDGFMQAGIGAGVMVGAAAVAIPLWIGTRTLRRMEF